MESVGLWLGSGKGVDALCYSDVEIWLRVICHWLEIINKLTAHVIAFDNALIAFTHPALT